jgi:Uma2 family endonuclease
VHEGTRYEDFMSTVQEKDGTFADLLDQLGGISPRRIRMYPSPGTATEQDVIELHDHGKGLYELVDGVLVAKILGYPESVIAIKLAGRLDAFASQYDLGVVAGADGMMKLAAGLVRIPDVSFVPWDQFPKRKIPSKPIPRLSPKLAVEVLSEGNTEKEMARKCQEYFTAGAELVWLVDPASRTVRIYTSPAAYTVIREDQQLDGGKVLPGFTLNLRELFGALARPRRGARPKRR